MLTLSVGSSTPVGTYPLTITGTSGSLVHTTTISLTVVKGNTCDNNHHDAKSGNDNHDGNNDCNGDSHDRK